ncbi:fused MFS/spermidine synthase [Candidatus Poribacteria bacterium]|nr:fused MFS/spermidine synthase [Candidatus Poribacteria bacterium]
MLGQILLMREMIVVFYGNELSLGIMLGAWLFWVGVGSLLAAVLLPRFKVFSRLRALALSQALLGLAAVGSFLAARALPSLLRHASVGEILGYAPIVVSSFLMLSPMCLLLGFLFDAFCHVWSGEEDAAASIGSVYVFEALGAASGGVAFAWILVKVLEPSEIAWLLLVINMGAAAAILALDRRHRWEVLAVSALAVATAVTAFFGGSAWLRAQSLEWLWRELKVTHSEDSIYGNIAFVEKEEQKTLYENGLLMFSYPDRFSAEEAVHFALLEHPLPKSVLLIGGGVNGSLTEVLKHPVEKADYIELDPRVIGIVGKFFPSDITSGLENPRAAVHTVDGRLYVKTTHETYDVIIINLPDPYTALINRFYTLEFFRECKNRLASDGILSFRVGSAENYISPELQQFLGCLDKTLREVFPDVKVIPGESNVFLACCKPAVLTLDSDELIRRLDTRGIKEKLQYIREYYLPYRLSEERKERLASALATAKARLNTDLAPICYYYDAVLWSKQFKDVSGDILSSLARVRPFWIFVGLGVVVSVALLIQQLFPISWGQKSLLVAVATTGFAEIAVEVVTLLGFQAIHGFVYYKVAIITTAFMAGLTVGAFAMARSIERNGASHRAFLLVQSIVCLYPLLLLGALLMLSRAGATGESPGALVFEAQVSFPFLGFFAGFVGGLQFPLASALWLEQTPGAARAAGYTYGVDLLGSCLGAMLTSTILVPLMGIPYACLTASLLNVGSLLLLLLRRG